MQVISTIIYNNTIQQQFKEYNSLIRMQVKLLRLKCNVLKKKINYVYSCKNKEKCYHNMEKKIYI